MLFGVSAVGYSANRRVYPTYITLMAIFRIEMTEEARVGYGERRGTASLAKSAGRERVIDDRIPSYLASESHVR
jgi:hypothetical protein